jgi:hypothetical protein
MSVMSREHRGRAIGGSVAILAAVLLLLVPYRGEFPERALGGPPPCGVPLVEIFRTHERSLEDIRSLQLIGAEARQQPRDLCEPGAIQRITFAGALTLLAVALGLTIRRDARRSVESF